MTWDKEMERLIKYDISDILNYCIHCKFVYHIDANAPIFREGGGMHFYEPGDGIRKPQR